MSLKYKLETLDGLSEEIAALYKEVGGVFILQAENIEGSEDTEALRNAKAHEKNARKKAEDDLAELRSEFNDFKKSVEDAKHDDAKSKGDIDAVTQSYEDKIAKMEGDHKTVIEGLQGQLRGVLVDSAAKQMATELAIDGSSDVILPHIMRRLGMDEREGNQVTIVLDQEGRPSALSLDELKTEISENPAFAPVIRGSKSSGGGTGAGEEGSGASGTVKDLAGVGLKERTAAVKAKVEAGS